MIKIRKGDIIMTNNPIFRGVATAIITPMTEQCEVDYEAFERLIEWQIAEGINAIVVCGTTGERSTLTDDEHKAVIKFAVEKVAGRIPVIAGTGSNETAYAIELTRHACEVGADAVLVVTPYYNKATQNGLVAHYTAIADASTVPVIIYNVPSRTGLNILPATYAKMMNHPRLQAIKEANSNIVSVVETAALIGNNMDIYSGNDDQIVPLMSMGGQGVISVLSNVMPAKTVEICDRFFRGDIAGAAQLQCEMMPLIKALFSEVNPIPVRAAMAKMGYGANALRLPLTPMEPEHQEVLFAEMRRQGVID